MTQAEMVNLWVSFAEIYGHKWTSSFGNVPNDSWVAGLSDMTTADVTTGINAVINSGADWPPSLPEFISMCFEIDREIVIKRIWRDFGDSFRKDQMSYGQLEKIEKDRFLETKGKIMEESKNISKRFAIANSRNELLEIKKAI